MKKHKSLHPLELGLGLKLDMSSGGDRTAPTITSANTANCAENATLAHSLTANESVTWSIVGGADQARFELSGSTLRWASNGTKDYEAPNDADTNNTYVVTVRATDAANNTTDQTITVTVTDVAEGAPFSSVKLLMGFEGADASTSFDDESNSNHTITANGNAQIDTAQFKFGSSSLLLDGNGDYLSASDSADWDFGTGEFTVEAWVRISAFSSNTTPIIGQYADLDNDASKSWLLMINGGTTRLMARLFTTSETTILSTTTTLTTDTWYHVCLERNAAGLVRIYLNGAVEGSATVSAALQNTTQGLQIGRWIWNATNRYLNGWIDEVRVTKGYARYDGAFTPPTEAFPRS